MNTRIYNAKILSMNGNTDIIEGEIRIKENMISYVGTSPAPEDGLAFDREIDAKGNLVLPGFKNAHTHSAMTFVRSYADDMPLQQWLFERIFPMEGKLVPEHVFWFTKLAILEYLTSGITANLDMYFFRDEIGQAAIDMGYRTVMTSGMNDFGGTAAEQEEEFLRWNAGSDLVSYKLGMHAEYTMKPELMRSVAELAKKHQTGVTVHISETATEVAECRERYGMSPVAYLDSIGLFDFGGTVYHAVHVDENDIDIFKKRGIYVVTNPASNMKLASGICPTSDYLKAGVPMAIGTDGPASNNCLDFFREMFLVTALGKLRENDAAAVPAEEVLKMATVGGARAMGLSDCDCLAAGKKADIIMIDLDQPNMQPIHNPMRNLVYSGSKQNVIMTMVDGKVLYEKGQFDVGIDPHEIYAKVDELVKRDF